MAEHDYLAHADRLRLCDLMVEIGPAAPTLCEGWSTKDLAGTCGQDRRPDRRWPGLVVERLSGWSEKVRAGELGRPLPDLVAELRSGPPHWSPLAWARLDRLGNTHEMFVHYEDVRRARPDGSPALWWRRTGRPVARARLVRRSGVRPRPGGRHPASARQHQSHGRRPRRRS